LIAYFIGNISANKYQNPFTSSVKVIASQRKGGTRSRCTIGSTHRVRTSTKPARISCI